MVNTALITITGDRPEAFARCEYYMAQQTQQGWDWIVIDDGKEPAKVTMGQRYFRMEPLANGKESFRRNMLKGLASTNAHQIVFIEDDDAYTPLHVEAITAPLGHLRTRDAGKDGEVQISGQGGAKYYNLTHRIYKIHPNNKHASLCQTAIAGPHMKKHFESILAYTPTPERLDGLAWKSSMVPPEVKFLTPSSTTTVGMKGMPGRGGLGVGRGSRLQLLADRGVEDPDMAVLKKWLGADAEFYENLGLYQKESE